MTRKQLAVMLVAMLAAGPLLGTGIGAAAGAIPAVGGSHLPLHAGFTRALGTGRFTFVSNFESRTLANWSVLSGSAAVGTSPNYLGEPALRSSGSSTSPQVDLATSGFVAGASSVSFQAVLNTAISGGAPAGFIGLAGPHGFVAVVGVNGSTVWAGSNLSSATNLGSIPTGTAQPAGWVELSAVVAAGSTGWTMTVFVDRTDVAAASGLSVPNAGNYLGAEIETTHGTVAYTNIVASSYQIPTTIPGYNNMDGYGQGSGLLVTLLPRFTALTSQMTLSNWSIPQQGILSFQINAMNRIGTIDNTCFGFYQLGVDLDPNGTIAPWFVDQNNCVAHYFTSHGSIRVASGFSTPAGSRLTLKITYDIPAGQLNFLIIDHSITGVNSTVSASLAYTGAAFYGAYTQVEWQPCCSLTPISSYFFNGTLSGLSIAGGNLTAPMALPPTYMVPFALDVPPTWNYGYYQAATASYGPVA